MNEICDSNKKNAFFVEKKTNFLNYIIERNEIRIDSIILQTIKNWSIFINVKKLQTFLKFVNYNRKFIKNYSKIAIFLIKLIVKNIFWTWKQKKTRNLQQITINMFKRIDFENVRFTKINIHRDKRIKFNYKNLFQSKTWKQMTFSDLFFQKIFVNKTKL